MDRTTENSLKYHFADFTHANYRKLLRLARSKYQFRRFSDSLTGSGDPSILWRHDLDFCVRSALPLAEMEVEEGVVATYFINLRDPFYNVLSAANTAVIKRVVDLGHSIGLHFDFEHRAPRDEEQLSRAVREEACILEAEFGTPVRVFSFHNPTPEALVCSADVYGGLVSTYGRTIKERFAYCSDSNGYWRNKRLQDVLEQPATRPLQVLTHPIWWTPGIMSPRQKVEATVSSIANASLANYTSTLAEGGRSDIDW